MEETTKLESGEMVQTCGSEKPKLGIEQFFTRANANTGVEVPLFLPSGEDSGHRLTILGTDSDAYRVGQLHTRRELMRVVDMANGNQAIIDEAAHEQTLELLSRLVTKWTLPDPLTRENVTRLFREAPQIAEAVNKLSADRSLFFNAAQIRSYRESAPTLS